MTPLHIITSHLGAFFFLAIFYINWLLQGLSRRMGEVARMPKHYQGFIAGNSLIFIGTLGYMFICSASLIAAPVIQHPSQAMFLWFYLPLGLGLGINVVIALIYWGWLIREH